MRKIFLSTPFVACALLSLLLAASCKKLVSLITFTVSDSSSFTIPASGLVMGTVLSLPGLTVNTSAQSAYSNNNTSADYVQDVTLDQLTLTTTNPSTQNFDFLQKVSVYIATDAAGSNKVLLASLDPVPTGQTSISLHPAGNKLDLYLRSKSYTLFTEATLAKPLSQNTDVRADSRFNVRANLP